MCVFVDFIGVERLELAKTGAAQIAPLFAQRAALALIFNSRSFALYELLNINWRCVLYGEICI